MRYYVATATKLARGTFAASFFLACRTVLEMEGVRLEDLYLSRTNREPEYRRRLREKAEQDKNSASYERDRSAQSADIHEIVLAINAIDEKYDRETHKEHTRKKRDRFWDITGVVGLWLAAAVGVTAVWVGTHDAGQQRDVMRGQLEEMRDEQRPWIYVDIVPGGKIYWNQSGGLSFPVNFIYHNTGHLPGQFVFPQFEAHTGRYFYIPGNDLVSVQKRVCNEAVANFRGANGLGVTVFPGQQNVGSGLLIGISRDEWMNDIIKPDFGSTVRVYGCITYERPNKIIGSTGFAFMIDRIKPGNATDVFVLPGDPTQIPAEQLHISPWIEGGVWSAQ
jgi:hypothetical protein